MQIRFLEIRMTIIKQIKIRIAIIIKDRYIVRVNKYKEKKKFILKKKKK
jgi:hypothetical protein